MALPAYSSRLSSIRAHLRRAVRPRQVDGMAPARRRNWVSVRMLLPRRSSLGKSAWPALVRIASHRHGAKILRAENRAPVEQPRANPGGSGEARALSPRPAAELGHTLLTEARVQVNWRLEAQEARRRKPQRCRERESQMVGSSYRQLRKPSQNYRSVWDRHRTTKPLADFGRLTLLARRNGVLGTAPGE